MKHFMHLVALWKPPQRVVDGKLHKDQPYIETVTSYHDVRQKLYKVYLSVFDPELNDHIEFKASFTEEVMAAKRGAFGHHLVTTLGALHAEARAARISPATGHALET
jgi:hypothetical protein